MTSTGMNPFWNPRTQSLKPYVPGEQPVGVEQFIKLNTNENPCPPSPKAIAAMQAAVGDDLRLYPDPDAQALKRAIAEYYGVAAEQVFVGNGSDEVLAHCFAGLFDAASPIAFPDVSYSFYPVYTQLYGLAATVQPVASDFSIDLSSYPEKNGGVIFPNPNAPTGIALPLTDIEAFLQRNTESVVVVDEAYVDFGAESAVALVDKYPQLLVVQTFSKSRSLAGMRIGFAIGDPGLIEGLERVKNSFNSYPLGRVAQAGAVAAILDKPWFAQSCQQIMDARANTTKALMHRGFDVLPSAANFVFAKPPKISAEALYQMLKVQKILVRFFKVPQIEEYLRITIGTPEEMQALLDAVDKIFAE